MEPIMGNVNEEKEWQDFLASRERPKEESRLVTPEPVVGDVGVQVSEEQEWQDFLNKRNGKIAETEVAKPVDEEEEWQRFLNNTGHGLQDRVNPVDSLVVAQERDEELSRKEVEKFKQWYGTSDEVKGRRESEVHQIWNNKYRDQGAKFLEEDKVREVIREKFNADIESRVVSSEEKVARLKKWNEDVESGVYGEDYEARAQAKMQVGLTREEADTIKKFNEVSSKVDAVVEPYVKFAQDQAALISGMTVGGIAISVGAPVVATTALIGVLAGGLDSTIKYFKRMDLGVEREVEEYDTSTTMGKVGKVLSGPGHWLDSRADSELTAPERAMRDALDHMMMIGGWSNIKIGGKIGSKVLGPLAKEIYLPVKALVMESAVVKKALEWESKFLISPLQKTADAIFKTKFIPTKETYPTLGKNDAVFRTKKSISEVMVSPIDRMPSRLQNVFRDNQVLKSQLIDWGEEYKGLISQQVDPLVIHDLRRGLRGTPSNQLRTKEGREIVDAMENKLIDIKMPTTAYVEFKNKVGEALSAKMTSPGDIFIGEGFTKELKPVIDRIGQAKLSKFMEKYLPEEVNIGPVKFMPKQAKLESIQRNEMRKGLQGIFDDPFQSRDVRVAARDMYNMGAFVAEEVGKAAKSTFESGITERLINRKDIVRIKPPKDVGVSQWSTAEGPIQRGWENIGKAVDRKLEKWMPETTLSGDYLPSQWPGFIKNGESLWVKRDVELELRGIMDIPKMSNSVVNKWFMTPWKIGKVILRPAAWMRNGLSNLMLNQLGGLPATRLDIYGHAIQGMAGSDKKFLNTKLSEHWKRYKSITGAGGTFSLNDVMTLNKSLELGAGMNDKLLSKFHTLAKPGIAIYSAEEQMFKFAKYLHNLEQNPGMARKAAAWDAMKWTFNYGEVTRATGFMRSNAAPFFTWQSKIFPLMFDVAINNPLKTIGVMAGYSQMSKYAFENVGMNEEESKEFVKMLPQWVSGGMMFPLPWRDERGRVQVLDMTYIVPGFGDAVQMGVHPGAALLQNPLITIAAAMSSNRKYSGAEIWNEWDDWSVQGAKQLSYLGEQILPATTPGLGTDYRLLKQAFIDTPMSEYEAANPRDLSRSQALMSVSGFKTTPFDEESVEQKFRARENISKSQMKMYFDRKIKEARSDNEKEDLMNEYSELLQRKIDQREE